MIVNNGNLIGQDKIKIDKKVTLFEYSISLNLVGRIPLEIELLSSCYYGINEKIPFDIDVVQKSEKRDKKLNEINKRKIKIGLSYFQELLKEAGMDYGSDGEDEEEENEEKVEENNEDENIFHTKDN